MHQIVINIMMAKTTNIFWALFDKGSPEKQKQKREFKESKTVIDFKRRQLVGLLRNPSPS